MTAAHPSHSPHAKAAYAALRHGGAPAAHARVQLGLSLKVALRLERTFQARKGWDPMRPRFARHDLHVTQVVAEGGFPVLPERPR
jgi:hypothetical protein